MTTLMHRQTTVAYEKAVRLTSDHPRRRFLNSPVRYRLVRPSWCWVAQSLIKELARTLTSRELLPDQIDCPWASKGSWEVCPEGDIGGSATGATTAEGADLANPVIIHTSEERGVELTCSYEEKKTALLLALD